jgi:acyl carrier protein
MPPDGAPNGQAAMGSLRSGGSAQRFGSGPNLRTGQGLTLMEDPKQKDQAQQMIAYILREVIRGPGIQITEDTPLVSSGLIDSLALVNILHKLEEITEMRIPAGKIQLKNMDTVNLMFAAAQRLGKPRK